MKKILSFSTGFIFGITIGVIISIMTALGIMDMLGIISTPKKGAKMKKVLIGLGIVTVLLVGFSIFLNYITPDLDG